jgi:hypothetical protein
MSKTISLDELPRKVARLRRLSDGTEKGYPSTILRFIYFHGLAVMLAVVFGTGVITLHAGGQRGRVVWKQYDANPFTFQLSQPRPDETAGGIVAADVNNDGLMDYLYTAPGSVGAYDHFGKTLWVKQVDVHLMGVDGVVGLPGIHGPGVQAADVDGDGKTEVLFLKTDGSLVLCDGATGKNVGAGVPASPKGAARWQHLVVCNLRGKGDRDVVLQTSGKDERAAGTFPAGRFVAALAIEDLEGKPLWSTTRFHGQAHGALKVADVDGDGRDEVCALSLYDHDGTLLTDGNPPRGAWHIDSIAIADVRPDLPGLEVAMTVEGTRHVGLVGVKGGIWWQRYEHREADKVAVGEFDTSRAGLEIWGRGSFDSPDDRGQFVFDAQGNVIALYELAKVAPKDWTVNGAEEIGAIHWTGEPKQYLAAKERHEEGDVDVFNPMTGKFIERFTERAARLYVADVSGDWREELVVVNGSEVHVYWNPKPNLNPNRPRLWTQNHYRRSKMNWNYYSP